ncbi:uncharacterized protein LOC143861451 isoform X2 [Tasmannia lanceolata]|uniref:uncharacterized protein LOC143861451 isoform X2 n=1 Tax=Tasmannia lanceolata TaxID=3420 RepID=UPI0040648CA2
MDVSEGLFMNSASIEEGYRPLPSLYLGFLLIWIVSAVSWTINTWKKRHFQANNLQWALASVPLIKALQLGLSFLFWYSCFNLQICSLWMSFGVYVTGVLFQTASFVSFLLISHGYCIISERLSVPERRTTAALGFALYLTLVGYKAAVPYFTVLLMVNYFVSFYVIFHHISLNLLLLREQLNFIEDENIQAMHDAVYTKYTMLKKFQGAMQMVAVVEIVVYFQVTGSVIKVLCYAYSEVEGRENSASYLQHCKEMDAADFKDLASHEWNIGVPTSVPSTHLKNSMNPLLIIVQHPRPLNRNAFGRPASPKVAIADAMTTTDLCSRTFIRQNAS